VERRVRGEFKKNSFPGQGMKKGERRETDYQGVSQDYKPGASDRPLRPHSNRSASRKKKLLLN
jgi:hypothetical protein